jgi:hypothetical protein
VRELIIISIVIRMGLLAPLNLVFHILVKTKKIHPTLVGVVNSLLGLPFVGWYLYITIHFFQGGNTCDKDSKALYWAYMILLVESVFYYFRCCAVIIIVAAVLTY